MFFTKNLLVFRDFVAKFAKILFDYNQFDKFSQYLVL